MELATVEFAIEAILNDWSSGVMTIEWDGDDDKLTVDEAFITLGGTDTFKPFLQAGRFVVPFGLYDGNTISDPLTKEAFETKEDSIRVGTALGPFTVGGYFFNGDTNEGGGDSHIEQFGIEVGYGLENESVDVEINLGYLSSVVDSDTLAEQFDTEGDYVSGIGAQLGLRAAGSSKPSALHLELGYNIPMDNFPTLITLAYSATRDLAGVLPESRVALATGIELSGGLGVNAEYTHDIDYSLEDGGTGENSDTIIAQLVYEF